jgi:hypothetical protein
MMGSVILFVLAAGDIVCAQSIETRSVKNVFPAYTGVAVRQEDATLRAVRFSPSGVGIAVGDLGVILRSADGGRTWTQVPSPVDAPLRDVMWLDHQRVTAIGGWCEEITGLDYGVVLSSTDGGETFVRQDDQQLPLLDHFCRDDESRGTVSLTRVAGSWSPVFLTDHFSTRDGGRTWQADSDDLGTSKSARPITDRIPIDEIAVHDEARLPDGGRCAVGDCGIIWRQSSGDQVWQTVRGNDRRIGATVLVSSPKQIPWASIAEECLVENHRIKVLVIASSMPLAERYRLEQASMQVGAVSLDVVATLTDALMHLASHDQQVLAFDDQFGDNQEKDIYSLLALNKIRRAVRFSSGIPDSPTGEILLPTIGQMRSDFAEDVQGLIDAGTEPHSDFAANVVFHQGSSDDTSRKSMNRTFTAGMNLPIQCRREKLALSVSRHRLQMLTARTSLRAKIEQRICDSSEQALDPETLESELTQWIRRCDPADRERLTRQIYRKVIGSVGGPLQSALEFAILRAASKQLSDRPMGRWSAWREAQLHRSAEMVWQSQVGLSDSVAGQIQQASHTVAVSPFQIETQTAAIPIGYGVDTVMPSDSTNLPDTVHERSQDKSTSLRWSSHPAVLVSQSSKMSEGIDSEDPDSFSATQTLTKLDEFASGGLRLLRQDPAWFHLIPNDFIEPANVVSRVDQRPYLDGHFNEWESPPDTSGNSSDMAIRFAHDGQYLYIASRFRAETFETSPSQVIRDAASSDRSRWSLRLDSDRDLVTYFQFMVDDKGQTSDGVNYDSSLDVTWYFASDVSEPGWVSIEAAIALADLGATKIRSGDSWFASSVVLAPGEDHRSQWMPDPKQWKLLRFE